MAAVSHLVPIEIEYQYDSRMKDYCRIEEIIGDLYRYGIQVANIGVTPILTGRGDTHFPGGVGAPDKMRGINDFLHEAGFPVYQSPRNHPPCLPA